MHSLGISEGELRGKLANSGPLTESVCLYECSNINTRRTSVKIHSSAAVFDMLLVELI